MRQENLATAHNYKQVVALLHQKSQQRPFFQIRLAAAYAIDI